MAQNENGEETQKSEHDTIRAIVSSTTLLSLAEADGGRCGREVFPHIFMHLRLQGCPLLLFFLSSKKSSPDATAPFSPISLFGCF